MARERKPAKGRRQVKTLKLKRETVMDLDVEGREEHVKGGAQPEWGQSCEIARWYP